MGEPITKQQREAMREDAASARHAFCRDDVPRLLGALEAAEAETERTREAAQVAEADAQRLTAEMERLRPLAEAAQRVVDAADACDREAERNHPSSRSSAPVARAINAMKKLRAALLAAREVTP